MNKQTTTYIAIILLLTLVLSSGCTTTPEPRQLDSDPVFYPAPPASPRLQFLRTFNSSSDIDGGASAFDSFLTGQETKGYSLIKPYGVASANGKIYICDVQASVEVFNLEKKKMHRMEGAKGLGKVVQPLNISITENNNKFVTDPVRGEVLMYNKEDQFVKSFGLAGKWKPTDAAAFQNLLYVVDAQNRDIKVFDIKTKEHIKTLGRNNEESRENLAIPTNLTIDKKGKLFISDTGRFQVVIYNRDGRQRGEISKPGINLGHLARPRGIALDRDNLIYIVDAAFENVQIFREDGQFLMAFGGSGKEPGNLFLPADVYIDYDNIEYFRDYIDPDFETEYLVFVTSQFGRKAVSVYAFGKHRKVDYLKPEDLKKKAQQKLKQWDKGNNDSSQK